MSTGLYHSSTNIVLVITWRWRRYRWAVNWPQNWPQMGTIALVNQTHKPCFAGHKSTLNKELGHPVTSFWTYFWDWKTHDITTLLEFLWILFLIFSQTIPHCTVSSLNPYLWIYWLFSWLYNYLQIKLTTFFTN